MNRGKRQLQNIDSVDGVNEITMRRASAFLRLSVDDRVMPEEVTLGYEDRLQRRAPPRSNKGSGWAIDGMNLCHGVSLVGVLNATSKSAFGPEC